MAGLRWTLFALAGFALAGVAFALWLRTIRTGNPDPANWFNVFYVLFARNEAAGLALVVTFAAAALLWFRRGSPAISLSVIPRPGVVISLLAVAAFAISAAGTWNVFQHHALTADENMADFQARIFLSGKIQQEVPEFWRPMVRLIRPTYAIYSPVTHTWTSSYLPVYAAIRALFMSIGLQGLTNPFLAGISVLTMAGVARNIWPNDCWKPVLAAGLLAASPQFLVMSMTGYAMPAHLALNLVWLWLYSDPNKRRFWLAPIVGVAALGLHQPFFHALFVTPFLFRLLLERRWRAVFWFGAVYSAGIIGWYAWWHHFIPTFSSSSKSTFGIGGITPIIQFMYLALLLGWLAFPVPLLALLGMKGLAQARTILRDAAFACLLTFAFYIFVKLDQAHGWGDRYFHGALGCLILLAVAGWDVLAGRIGRAAAGTFVTIGVAAALFLQLPLRCFQAQNFARPFAHAADAFQSINADVVAFDPRMAWYSADLLRNDPFLQQRPIIVSFLNMNEKQALLLQKTFPRSRLITQDDLARLGLETARRR